MPLNKSKNLQLYLVAALAPLCILIALVFTSPGQVDEVRYIDPGVNLSLGRGFNSSTWYEQSPEGFWACSTPAMAFLYAGWFKLVGFGLFQSKFLSLFFHLAGAWLLTRWTSHRLSFSLIQQTSVFIACLIMPVLAWAAVGCRLEVFALLFYAWFLYFTLNEKVVSKLHPFLFGALTPLFGLHFSGYFALAAAATFLYKREKRYFYNGLILAVGMAVGLLLLFIIYNHNDAINVFWEARASHYTRTKMAWVPTGWRMFTVSPDLVLLALIAFGLLAREATKRSLNTPQVYQSAGLALTVFFLTPVLINKIGIYYVTYGWMVAVPMLLLLFEDTGRWMNENKRIAVASLVLVALAIVYKTSLIVSSNLRLKTQHQSIARYIEMHTGKNEAIAGTLDIYYYLKPLRQNYFVQTQSPHWPKEIGNAINWAVNRRCQLDPPTLSSLSGDWEEVKCFPSATSKNSADDYVIWHRK